MISEKAIQTINKIVSKETFKYTGEIIAGVDMKVDIDYKFQITGHRKMMSVGEYYDYLLLKVVITSLNDNLSKTMFGFHEKEKELNLSKAFESRLYKFYSDLNREIGDYLTYFNDSNEIIRTTIDDLTFDLKKPLNLENTEKLHIFVPNLKKYIIEAQMSRMSKIAVRTTVKDIVNIIKKGEEGNFYLPGEDGEEYEFGNLPFKYSVELILKFDNDLNGFKINANYSSDDDVIEVLIVFNPKKLRKNLYNIIGELNDIISHELEHGFQYMTEGKIYQDSPSESFDYYTQPDEIKAPRVGFRRVAKLRKLPYKDVVKDWFETHKDIHGLTESEMDKVIKIILNDK
jgi:hypothetical protein